MVAVVTRQAKESRVRAHETRVLGLPILCLSLAVFRRLTVVQEPNDLSRSSRSANSKVAMFEMRKITKGKTRKEDR